MGLQRLSWKAMDTQKPEKTHGFSRIFANAGFRYFEALDGPPGPILAPLGPIWSQNGSKMEAFRLQKRIFGDLGGTWAHFGCFYHEKVYIWELGTRSGNSLGPSGRFLESKMESF